MKIFQILPLLLSLSLFLTACGVGAADTDAAVREENIGTQNVGATTNIDTSDLFSDRDLEADYDESAGAVISLDGNTASCDSNAVSISGNAVTITDEGTYVLTGALKNGMIIVDAEKTDKVQLVLAGVDIHSDTSAALYVRQADKVFITLAYGSINTLSSGEVYTAIDENNIDAVIFSKDDLTLNGSGSLTIVSPAGHGVVSKDDLVITDGTYDITTAGHGLSGKDSLCIADGSFDIVSGKDAIHAENEDDTTLGYLYIADGTFTLTADWDGVSASGDMLIMNGDFSITTGGGSAAASSSRKDQNFAAAASDDTVSTKGVKAAGNLTLNGGSFTIDSADDALHSNANLTVSGGSCLISTGDDGLHADGALSVSGGSLQITESYEGLEGKTIDISGGEIDVTSSDDGLNAAGGNDASGFGGNMGADGFSADSDIYIHISGGTVNINASGDGVDSNGNLTVSGGKTFVSGPTNNGNGAVDYNGEAVITGGIFIAAGSSGMAQNFGSSSTQGAIMVTVDSQPAGSTISLQDENGTTLISFEAEKTFASVVVSCPEIAVGKTYTLSAGSYKGEVVMSSLIYGSGGGMGGGGQNKGGGHAKQP
jgi:hypothetical protein